MVINQVPDRSLQSNNMKNEQDDEGILKNYITDLENRLLTRERYRAKHQAVFQRQSDSLSSRKDKLDSSVKKNTTFVKKLKVFTAAQLEPLLSDLKVLNCSKYVSEVATAIVEAKLKMTDIEAAVKFCSEITEIYPEFSQHFLECWQKLLSMKFGDKITNLSKLRIDLRFFAELILIGLFNNNKTALSLLGNLLTILINMDKDEHVNFSIILTFCKTCGEDFAAILPRKMRILSEKYKVEVPKSKFLPLDKQLNVQNLIKEYYNSMCKHLKSSLVDLRECEKQNNRILQTKGELSSERKDHFENLQNSHEKLLNAVQNFAELLDVDMPELMTAEADNKEENIEFLTFDTNQENSIDVQIWPDTEIRKFYTELINLREYLPSNHPLLINLNKKITEKIVEKPIEEDLDKEISDDEDKNEEPIALEEEIEEQSLIPASNKAMFDAFLNNLPNCINRELIDSAAINFATTLNNKHTRKKITRVLFGVNRTRLDLLPFYARFAANLYQAIPDIGNELAQMLRVDFKYHVKKRDQINFESKIKVVRYIGEMVKFRIYPKVEALFCLKILLNNFNHHHIEMTCNLLEVCGRFLFLNPESHPRTKVYVEQMMRKKSAISLDSRYVMQIDNAYYQVNPPESGTVIKQKERPVLHLFFRKLLFDILSRSTLEKTSKLLRKFNWDDRDFFEFGVKCLMSAFKLKYFNIHYLAAILNSLNYYHEDVIVCVIDRLFEDIRLGLETNLTRFNQRRVAQIHYLGELHSYRLISSNELFKVLYSLITFGVTNDHAVPSLLDPADNLFRIKLVCVLLEVTGPNLSVRSDRKRLDYFLIFFQSYYWFKKSDPFWTNTVFPVTIEHLFEDTVKNLRPKFRLVKSYEKSLEEIEKMKKQLGIDAVLSKLFDNKDKNDLVYGLEIINETEEDDFDADLKKSSEMSEDDFDEKEVQQTEDEYCEEEETEDEKNLTDESINCAEDAEFVASFEKMISENIQERMKVNVKPKNVDISIPRSIKSNKKSYSQLQEPNDKDKMNFVLILRKGNKSKCCSFQADLDSDLAKNLRNREQAEREEKEKVKQLTLNITERLEEEDYREMLQQQQRLLENNFNREKKKYQHPKGAPDADLIFGTK